MTKPSLACYIIACQDDTDVLGNALRSVGTVADTILLVDTGLGSKYQYPRTTQPTVKEFFLETTAEGRYSVTYTNQVSLYGGEDRELATTPGRTVRLKIDYSQALNHIGQLLKDYDWVLRLDSDEMLSRELVADLPDYLAGLPSNVVTIAPYLLTLWPSMDMTSYARNYSQALTHGRIYRPLKIGWRNPIHEHQDYDGERVVWPRWWLHFRQIFQKRCIRQNGHGGDAWANMSADIRPVSELNVSWEPIVIPDEEHDA